MIFFKKKTLRIEPQNAHLNDILQRIYLSHYLSTPYKKKRNHIIYNYETLKNGRQKKAT